MIGTDLIGRTGNNLFQIATTIATAREVGTDYQIPEQSMNKQEWPLLFDHFPKLQHGVNLTTIREAQDFSWTKIPKRDNLRLHGYWQNENYFKEHRQEIIEAFRIPWNPNKGVVSIHVRRGDYVFLATKHPPISHDYLKQALKYFYSAGYSSFLVFSDDIEWCKEYFLYWENTGIEIAFSEGRDTLTDLSLMSSCQHHIIANSTYSWWAAWLNQNPDKIVVSPSKYNWFGKGNSNLKTDGIIPDSWIQIKY